MYCAGQWQVCVREDVYGYIQSRVPLKFALVSGLQYNLPSCPVVFSFVV